MRQLLAALLSFVPFAAWAQTPQPIPGSFWEYHGPTLGSGWSIISPAYSDLSNVTLPTARTNLGLGTASSVAFAQGELASSLGNMTLPRLYSHGGVFGTTSGGGIKANHVLNTDSDSVDCTSAGGCYNSYFGHAFGGLTVKGNRTGAFSFLNLTAPTGNGSGQFYTALGSEARATSGDGGSPGSPRGSVFAANFIARLTGTSTNMNSVVGTEIDVGADGSSTVAYKAGLGIVQLATDNNRGSVADTALQVANQYGGTAPGWLCGICFSGPTGWWPIASTGTIMGTLSAFAGGPSYAAAYGIDFSSVSFSSGFLKSTGFLVDGSGVLTSANHTISASSGALTVQDTRAVASGVGGAIALQGKNSGGSQVSYGGVHSYAFNGGVGAEAGHIVLQTMNGGTLSDKFWFTNNNRLVFGALTNANVALKPSATLLQIRNGDDTGYGTFEAASVRIIPISVSALPTCNAGAEGTIVPVTDANSATFNAAVAGGGANRVLAYCNGTGWTVH